ncbi:MAG TPA: DUF4232 domain-containing protein [Streptosporangiaceae bacterium]|jgi:hypothetical protein
MSDGHDGHDEFDDWLRSSVEPLPPPPGTYDRVRRQARRRRLGKALAVGTLAAVVVVGGATVPRMLRGAEPQTLYPKTTGSSGTLATPRATAHPTHSAPDRTSTPSHSSAASGSLTPEPHHSQAPPPAAGPSRCHTGDLSVRVTGGDAGAGQRYAGVVLTNTSSRTCTVYGYIGVALSGPAPTDLIRDPGDRHRVTLPPGGAAATSLHWTAVPADGEGPNCGPRPASIAITPPDETTQHTVSWPYGGVCQHGEMHTVPLVRGSSPPPI